MRRRFTPAIAPPRRSTTQSSPPPNSSTIAAPPAARSFWSSPTAPTALSSIITPTTTPLELLLRDNISVYSLGSWQQPVEAQIRPLDQLRRRHRRRRLLRLHQRRNGAPLLTDHRASPPRVHAGLRSARHEPLHALSQSRSASRPPRRQYQNTSGLLTPTGRRRPAFGTDRQRKIRQVTLDGMPSRIESSRTSFCRREFCACHLCPLALSCLRDIPSAFRLHSSAHS